MSDLLVVRDLGRVGYAEAYAEQVRTLESVIAAREGAARVGELLFVEHDPVITVTRRAGAAGHVLADDAQLGRLNVEVHETDRGGDVTYHGPGQIVGYPIVDLNRVNCRLHAYLRLLEQTVIDAIGAFGVVGVRDQSATGVWVHRDGVLAKVCAIGVRVRRWVTMHGFALNVEPELSHFGLIVPCGLHGRPVTSLRELLGDACPSMDDVRRELAARLSGSLEAMAVAADELRDQGDASVAGGSQR
ncbi:MAG: lipoyl(octanoyl) transferase LipB [Planctomycetota bacterium]